MGAISISDNRGAVMAALKEQKAMALEIVGQKAESYAKLQVYHPKALAVELRNSIGHTVDNDTVGVGSNQEVAAYVELGTGPNYQPPPEWLENNAPGGKGQAGLKYWIYFDPLENAFKIGTPQEAHPFLRPAIENHLEEYKAVIKGELEGLA